PWSDGAAGVVFARTTTDLVEPQPAATALRTASDASTATAFTPTTYTPSRGSIVYLFAIRADRVSNGGVSFAREALAGITIPQRLLIASAVVYGGLSPPLPPARPPAPPP